jgi:hypothetical protein
VLFEHGCEYSVLFHSECILACIIGILNALRAHIDSCKFIEREECECRWQTEEVAAPDEFAPTRRITQHAAHAAWGADFHTGIGAPERTAAGNHGGHGPALLSASARSQQQDYISEGTCSDAEVAEMEELCGIEAAGMEDRGQLRLKSAGSGGLRPVRCAVLCFAMWYA